MLFLVGATNERHYSALSELLANGVVRMRVMRLRRSEHVRMEGCELLSIWEIACRWNGIEPGSFEDSEMPEQVEEALIKLTDAANHVLNVYDENGNHIPKERLGLAGFRPTKFALQLHGAQFHPEDEGPFLRRSFLKREEVVKWLYLNVEVVPEFWFRPDEIAESKERVANLRGERAAKLRKDQQDRQKCQGIARELWATYPMMTIADMARRPEILIEGNGKAYVGKNTLRNWLSEVAPAAVKRKRGRPKKSKADAGT